MRFRQNTEAIGGSTKTIDGNTQAIRDSTAATANLVPALQGVERLRMPMEAEPRGGGGAARLVEPCG